MSKYYVRHKLSPGDITNLPDNTSEIIIKDKTIKEEELIEVEAPNGIFLAQLTYIDKASVEIEVIRKIEEKRSFGVDITIIQSLSNDFKFDYFLEKAVEIGVGHVIPACSEYSLLDIEKANKKVSRWNDIIKKSAEQSRNPNPPELTEPIKLSDLRLDRKNDQIRICLATEPIETFDLKLEMINDRKKEYIIAIGPERGWSSNDLEYFRKNNFRFIRLKGNILRTETAGIVISTIIKFINKEL